MTKFTGILAYLFLMGTLVDGGGPPTWDPQVQSQIQLTQPGVGSVYLKWPSANNNMFQMLGYQLYVGLMSDPTSGVVVLDSRGYPEVREYMQTGLVPGQSYNFTLIAWNQDPVSLNTYGSSPTTRQVNVNLLKSEDPTNLEAVVSAISSSGTLVAGRYSRISFQGIQPDSGLNMILGSVCVKTDQTASCVPGRNYVASFHPICVLDSTSTECIDPRENSLAEFLLGRPTRNWLNDYPSPNSYTVPVPVYSGTGLPQRYPGINEANTGLYTLDFAPPVAGTYSMLIEGTVPGKVTVMYWENENFSGSPANIDKFDSIDFDWSNNTIVQFTSDSVSVRVGAYLQPETDGTFQLQCIADTFCDVWVDDEPVLETVSAGTTTCETGCTINKEFEFLRSKLYAVRVEYVTKIGVSFLQLAWRDVASGPTATFNPIPSNVWVGRAFTSNTPYVISVASGRLSGKYSSIEVNNANFLREGFDSAIVNRPVTVYIHVKDETNSPCTFQDPWSSVYVTVEPVNVGIQSRWNMVQIPAQFLSGSNPSCVYTATVSYPAPGVYEVKGYVNGEMVSNSPLVTAVSLDVTQISMVDSVLVEIVPPAPIETDTAFSVKFRLANENGLDIPSVSPDWGAEILGMFEKRKNYVPGETDCSSRIDWNWSIECFLDPSDTSHAFAYVDDSILIGGSVSSPPSFTTITSWDLTSVGGQSFLTVHATTPAFSGAFEFSVRFDGALVTGNPVNVIVVGKSSATVDASVSLVMLMSPEPDTQEIFENSDILLRVLLRDSLGNPLTDRGSESVQLILTPDAPGSSTTTVTCSYVTGKYYDCAARPLFTGNTLVRVSVNGLTPSVVTGTPPVGLACKSASTCGFSDCPCTVFREPFSINLNVLSSD